MQADATGKQAVDIRAGVIKATAGEAGQTHGKATDRCLIADHDVRAAQPVTAVDPSPQSRR